MSIRLKIVRLSTIKGNLGRSEIKIIIINKYSG